MLRDDPTAQTPLNYVLRLSTSRQQSNRSNAFKLRSVFSDWALRDNNPTAQTHLNYVRTVFSDWALRDDNQNAESFDCHRDLKGQNDAILPPKKVDSSRLA